MDVTGKIYLCKPGGLIMGILSGIDENTVMLKQSAVSQWELTFDTQRYIDKDGKLCESDYYQSIAEMMELYLEFNGEGFYFQIDSTPQTVGDGVSEKKTISAHSIECALSSKYLKKFKVNCGTKDSQEYLVGYYDDDDNFINVNLNPYINLPIDYIVVHNTYAEELTEIKTILTNMDIRVNAANGMVTNESACKYLYELYEKYPRLGTDISYEGTATGTIKIGDIEYPDNLVCKTYIRVILDTGDANSGYVQNSLGYNIRIGADEDARSHTKQYLIDGVTSLINYYNTYGDQLSLLSLIIEKGQAAGWSAGHVPIEIAHKKYTFSVDNQDILSFLQNNCVSTMKVLFDFDRKNRKIGIIDVANEDQERDTGVFLTYRNLVNSVDIKTSSQDGMKTRFYPTGQNNLGILYANFGDSYITDLSWLIEKVNEYGEYQYVSKELHDKYNAWIDYKFNTPITVTLFSETTITTKPTTRITYDSRRDAYRELSKMYNQYMIDIDAEMNRLPNDGCSVDYTTYTFDELNIAYKAYVNALTALITLYKNDVGATTFDQTTLIARDANQNICTSIKDTFYWLDYVCYTETIIPNVLKALAMYVKTEDATCQLNPNKDYQYDKDKEEWIAYPGGNPWYNGDAKRVTENMSEAYLYDMDLYGTVELQAKQNAWREVAATLYKPGFVLKNSGAVVDPIPADGYMYNTANQAGWNKLKTDQYNYQDEFTSESSFERLLNEYLDYVSTTERINGLTKKVSKGVIAMTQDAINALQPKINNMIKEQDSVQKVRKQIADDVVLENWVPQAPLTPFTDEEITRIYELVREADYNNNNILITNLDDIATTVDAQEELYQDAVVALSEKAQPQLAFTIGMDNMYALPEFAQLAEDAKLLNFIRVSIGLYADEFVKLRIVEIQRNPIIPTQDLTVAFSNMTYSLSGISDLIFLFQNNTSGGGTGGGSGGTSGGTYGANDAEIQIANNMLNALLKSKTATTGITEVVIGQIASSEAYKKIMAQSGLFEKLETGDMKVTGACITDFIQSSNWNATTKKGSMLDLKNGSFSYADGKLTWDNFTSRLYIDGNVTVGNTTSGRTTLVQIDNGLSTVVEEQKTIELDLDTVYATYSGPTFPSSSGLKVGETFYNTSNEHYYIWQRTTTGVEIKLNSSSATESATYDYIQIYYIDKDGTYKQLRNKVGGSIGNKAIRIESEQFYLHWHTDSNGHDYYGFKVASISPISSNFDSVSTVSSDPVPANPTSYTRLYGTSILPESQHNPYGDNLDDIWYIEPQLDGSYAWVDLGKDPGYSVVLSSYQSKIDQTAKEITSLVSKKTGINEVNSLIRQTADQITLEVNEELSEIFINYQGNYIPTNTNSPASGWSSKAAHVGETFYNTANQHYYLYIFYEAGNNYTWFDLGTENPGYGIVTTGMRSKITQTSYEINMEVSKKVGNDEIISKINQTAEQISINANRISFQIGNGTTDNSGISVKNQSGTLIGTWNKNGIWTNNGEFIGKVSNGANTLYSDGRFDLGNGALKYDPRPVSEGGFGDNYVHLSSNMSLLYNGVSLVGEDVSANAKWGYYYGSSDNYALTTDSSYASYYTLWGYFTYVRKYIYINPLLVNVNLIFYSLSKDITKDSLLICGLPKAQYNSTIPVEIKLTNANGYFTGTTKMAHFSNSVGNIQNTGGIVLDQALTARSSSGSDMWYLSFSYQPLL